MKLYSYKLKHDSGFAPNPFGRTLTLATCKPGIRKTKQRGEWVAGFTSKFLTKGRDAVGSERLIYLMKVGDTPYFREYFNDEKFKDKIPPQDKNDVRLEGAERAVAEAGDNIYEPFSGRINALNSADFKQLENKNHPPPHHIVNDLSGERVLIADEFYYFGRCALELPDEIRPKVPRGPTRYGVLSSQAQTERFIEFIRKNYKPGRHGFPHHWDKDSKTGCGSCG